MYTYDFFVKAHVELMGNLESARYGKGRLSKSNCRNGSVKGGAFPLAKEEKMSTKKFAD